MKLLVVEDDLALSDVVDFTLRRAGFEVVRAYDGLTAVTLWAQEAPDLVLLDLNLPRLDGLAVCRQIRSQSDTPIIILSVRGGDEAVVKGLELGADDYIVKPFSPAQLVARVRALLRRASGSLRPAATLRHGNLELDLDARTARLPGREVHLTPSEFVLLAALVRNPGHTLSREQLMDELHGAAIGSIDRSVDSHIKNLRRKLEGDAPAPRYIETVYAVGYRFRPQE